MFKVCARLWRACLPRSKCYLQSTLCRSPWFFCRETDSIVVHLTSSRGIEGPYRYSDTVAAPRRHSPLLWDSLDCHNPTVHKLGTEYVVFYIGVGVNVTLPGDSPVG